MGKNECLDQSAPRAKFVCKPVAHRSAKGGSVRIQREYSYGFKAEHSNTNWIEKYSDTVRLSNLAHLLQVTFDREDFTLDLFSNSRVNVPTNDLLGELLRILS